MNKYKDKTIINKILRFLGILIIIAILVSVLVYIIINTLFSNSSTQLENFSTAITYTSTTLIYTSCISNNSWITSTYNSSYSSNIQYVYQSIPDLITWNSISDIFNNNNSSLFINENIKYNTQDGSPVINPISYVGVIVDTYEKSKISMSQINYKTISAPSGYFVAFTTPQKAMTMECSLDLGGKNIGYFGFTDEVFIDAILNGHRFDKNSVNKILIKEVNVPVLNGYMNNIDIFMTYIIPGSDFHKNLLKQRITFMGFANMDIARVSLFYPGLTMENNVNIRSVFLDLPYPNSSANNTATVTQKENITNLPTMKLELLLLKPVTPIEQFTTNTKYIPNTPLIPNITETFITRLDLPNSYLDPTYTCYGDITANIKALCDSAYDIFGKPKTRNTTWDHTCLDDTDCPYFKANKNYENNRGGCMDSGVCELPIGVRRISFRKYDDNNIFAPYCYGCDPYDTLCCSKQKNPDYAFANDTNDRIANGSNLSISIPLYN